MIKQATPITLRPRWRRLLPRAAALLLVLGAAACDQGKSPEDYTKSARESRAAGDISTAIADLKTALLTDPKNLTARLLLAQYYLDLPDPIGAQAVLWRAREDGAADTLIAKPLAQAELLMGNASLAIKTADLPDSAPPDVRASLLAIKAEAYVSLGRAQDAQDALETGLKLDPHSVDILVAMARYALAAGNLDMAQSRLAAAQKEAPGDVALLYVQGAVAVAAQNYPLAAQAYEQLLKAEPWNLSGRLGLAGTQIAEGKSDLADGNLGAVLKVSPADPRANYLSALVAYRNNDYDKAQARVQRALNAASNFAPALLLAGAAAFELHQYEQANAFLSQFLYQVPQYVQARKLLAAVQLALGRPSDAVKTLSQVVDGGPSDPQLFALMGAALAQMGDLAAADRYLRRALEFEPDNIALRTELGITQVALGQTEAGIEILEDTSRRDPAMLRPDIVLFVAYFKQKDYGKALEAAERLKKASPRDATGFDLAGAAHLAAGDEAVARTELAQARELRPGDPIACRSLAILEIRRGDYAAAAQLYGDILANNPHDVAAYVSLAELQDQQRLRTEAIVTLKKAIEQNPDAPAPRIALGQIYVFDHNEEAALAAIEPLANVAKDAGALAVTGEAYLGLRNFDAAITSFKALVDMQPESSFARRELASAYLQAGQLDLALTQAQQATAADPQDIAAKMVLARIYIAAGGADDARATLVELARRNPGDAFIAELQSGIFAQQASDQDGGDPTRFALAQAKAGNTDAAEAALKDWLEAHPDDVAPREALGDIELAAKRFDVAQVMYEAVLMREPNNAAAENNLAWTFSRLGNVQAALDHATRAASLAPNAPRVLDTLGVAFLANQRAGDAVDPLTKAAQGAPDDPGIQFHFAEALAGVGEKARALNVLRTVLAAPQAFDERDAAQSLMQSLGG